MVGGAGLLWLVAWLLICSSPPQVQTEIARPPLPTLQLLRDRWVGMFTSSRIFIDPARYFYIFWFPQYLKSASGLDLVSIGKFAWIPFLTADVGKLIGRVAALRRPRHAGAEMVGDALCLARDLGYSRCVRHERVSSRSA